MGYAKEREEFVARWMARGAKLEDVRAVLLAAGTLQRCGEIDCSVDIDDKERARMEAREARAMEHIRAAVKGWKVVPVFGGDPRGYVVKLKERGQTERDVYAGVPAMGFSGPEIDRMSRWWAARREAQRQEAARLKGTA